ncbi:NADH-quinone oxidoreductase subunit N [Aquihabitans sp. McL0605]|uniref:NADH-quinone oxidoreductase subunit N n=1 Tax=Aquihabitans sp. McL0605 TaxID=3415671 RepID=UPI003CFA10F3
MLATVLATAAPAFARPAIDWHALAPELILVGTIVVCLLVDLFTTEQSRWTASSLAGIGLLAALIPVATLAHDNTDRVLFGGAFVVDDFSLVVTGLFLVAGYLTILLSTNAIAEGDYAEGEYYLLVVSAVFGMVIMASARDLISIFIALEMLSIPAYLLAGWRKRTRTGNEAGMKYYLMGVFASAVMLYGMSLIFGGTGTTLLSEIGRQLHGSFGEEPVAVLGIVFVLIGFAFKISAVPFHNWAPDTYEGAPTPVTAFLSVASKAAGFVAILSLVFVGFYGMADTIRPLMFILAVLTMTVGNVIALRQTNIVRLFAYSSVAQAGFILAPLAVFGSGDGAADVLRTNNQVLTSVLTYLLIYAIVNLGAFAVIITVSRRTGTGEIKSWGGLWTYAPGLAVSMAAFLFALAGIPPAVGWFAKFQSFTAVVQPGTTLGYTMGVVMAINSVIALAYYLNVVRVMFMDDVPDGDVTPIKVPTPLGAVVAIALVATLVVGVFPGIVGDIAHGANFALAGR